MNLQFKLKFKSQIQIKSNQISQPKKKKFYLNSVNPFETADIKRKDEKMKSVNAQRKHVEICKEKHQKKTLKGESLKEEKISQIRKHERWAKERWEENGEIKVNSVKFKI